MGDQLNGGYLSREAIINTSDITTTDVPVPEWGGTVAVRVMTAAEREQYETSITELQKQGPVMNIRASLVAWCAVDSNGRRLFTPEDVAVLSTKSAVAVNRLFEAARKLNALTADETADIKKNSETIPADASPSA